ncbi:Hypothetical predicted protein [Olea europaea subsp. europaea]|uniref:Spindle and kinetochore-associated protein 3 n=1 Tax=Olea europaea subsp. europaea TaxID=158383 RepID=A0A8S0U9E5_OLEEU|nr:Hypothetical predicted protein [Olea europaea subsp. europaea]
MEELMGKFCKTVAEFCNHLQHSCAALKESVDRRPIPLDSASTTFVQSVNRRVSTAASDLNVLESMSFGTVSFEELLGHCNEVLKNTQNDVSVLEDHLRSSFNYIPPLDFGDDDVEDSSLDNFSVENSKSDLKVNSIEEDPLLDDSLSLKNFGISDVCLATIASQADCDFEMEEPYHRFPTENLEAMEGEIEDDFKKYEDSKHLINVSRDEYESLPKFMKNLTSWEDLLVAVGKLNSCLGTKRTMPDTFIQQDEIDMLGLGHKAKSYLVLLIKMNQLRVETINGTMCYRVL